MINTWSAEIKIQTPVIHAHIKYDKYGLSHEIGQVNSVAFHKDVCILTCASNKHTIINDYTSVRDIRRGLKSVKINAGLMNLTVGTDTVYITVAGMQNGMEHADI